MKHKYHINIEAWEKFEYPEQTAHFITGALVFITAVWLVGLLYTFIKARTTQPKYVSKFNHVMGRLVDYWHTELNKWTLRIWMAVGTIGFALWWMG